MADHLGTFNASSTVHLYFTTHATDGAPVAPSSAFEAADLLIYKNGSATQRSSANGITMTSPFDSVTGLHCVAIDLSDNTDASFYAAGSEYVVILNADETVDSVAVTKVLAYFSIERVAKVNVTQFGGSAGAFSGGRPEVNTTHLAGTSQTGRDIGASVLLTNGTGTGEISLSSGAVTAGNLNIGSAGGVAGHTTLAGLVTDIGSNGAGLTAIPWNWDAEVRTAVGLASANLDTQLSTIDTEVGVIDGIVDGIVADTENIQSRIPAALGPNGFIQADVRDYGGVDGAFTSGYPICVIKDNYSLGEEWADGGRLDLILDARASQSSVDTIDGNVDLILADTGTDGVKLSAATCNKIADHARRRTQANVEASSDGDTLGVSSLYGMIQQAQESNTVDNAGKLTVYRTDGTTELAQKTISTDETAEPITGIE